MTTGFTSAMIAFDYDVDFHRRKHKPALYGFIPDDSGARGRCFALMMFISAFISAFQNLSRSVGLALLIM